MELSEAQKRVNNATVFEMLATMSKWEGCNKELHDQKYKMINKEIFALDPKERVNHLMAMQSVLHTYMARAIEVGMAKSKNKDSK